MEPVGLKTSQSVPYHRLDASALHAFATARQLSAPSAIGHGHLLLALVDPNRPHMSRQIRDGRLNLKAFQSSINSAMADTGPSPSPSAVFSQSFTVVINLAETFRVRRGDEKITTTDLLLAYLSLANFRHYSSFTELDPVFKALTKVPTNRFRRVVQKSVGLHDNPYQLNFHWIRAKIGLN